MTKGSRRRWMEFNFQVTLSISATVESAMNIMSVCKTISLSLSSLDRYL